MSSIGSGGPGGDDPRIRANLEGDDLSRASIRPLVAQQSAALPVSLVALGVALLGFGAFMWMSGQRTARQEAPITALVTRTPQITAAASPEPLPLPEATTSLPAQAYRIPAPQFTVNNALPTPPTASGPLLRAGIDPAARRKAPALVVDLSPAGGGETVGAAIPNPSLAKPGGPLAAAAASADGKSDLSTEEKFADRISGGETEKVKATQLKNLDTLIPQGAVIPGVLETAINSDLPGFARAVVSRDVMGFDGTNVLIPRGSRLIGQYKSGVALGQSRVFVIWSRLIRPDGVSVQIGSPGTDPLGRGGLDGEVNRHFFSRFGSAILLSVVTAGIPALINRGNSTSNEIIIGSTTDATNVAATALQKDQNVGPTVKTPQGTPIRIFVARDLDFFSVGPAKTPVAAGPVQAARR
jgi:type IV secretory pathway VirB10-like protein